MEIKSLRAEEHVAVRRVANPHLPHPPERNARRESLALPSSSTKYFRCGEMNSRRYRSKSPIVEKPPMKKLTMENVRILKRESAAKNHQATEKVIMDVAPDQCSTNRNSTVLVDPPKDIPVVNPKPQFYAGSGFFSSPPPSSLPHPTSLLQKKESARSSPLFSLSHLIVSF